MTAIWPRSALNLIALVSRFETTCCRRAGSPATAPTDSSRTTSSSIDLRCSGRSPRRAPPGRPRDRSTARSSTLSLPATMRDTSSRSSMSCICIRVARSMTSPARVSFAASTTLPRRSICACSSMLESGVRSSWASIARNRSLARLALLRLGSRLLRFADEVLERVDVDERQDGAVDLVVGGLVGADLHPIPAPVAVLDLGLLHRHRVDDLGDLLVEIGDVDVGLDVVERTPECRRGRRSGCSAPWA